MTTCSTSCGTSPRDVLPPNPLRHAAEETASHRHDEADRAPTIGPKRQDAQPVGERHDGAEQKERTGEVTVKTATAGRVGDACRASHRERRCPQDRAYGRPDDDASD